MIGSCSCASGRPGIGASSKMKMPQTVSTLNATSLSEQTPGSLPCAVSRSVWSDVKKQAANFSDAHRCTRFDVSIAARLPQLSMHANEPFWREWGHGRAPLLEQPTVDGIGIVELAHGPEEQQVFHDPHDQQPDRQAPRHRHPDVCAPKDQPGENPAGKLNQCVLGQQAYHVDSISATVMQEAPPAASRQPSGHRLNESPAGTGLHRRYVDEASLAGGAACM